MLIPSTVPRVGAVLSSGSNYWSAYGPNVDNLLYAVYFDFGTMFTAFQNGQLDYTDWPVQASDLGSFVNNPYLFVAPNTAQAEAGTFQLDVNYANPLFGVGTVDNWQTARGTLSTPTVAAV